MEYEIIIEIDMRYGYMEIGWGYFYIWDMGMGHGVRV